MERKIKALEEAIIFLKREVAKAKVKLEAATDPITVKECVDSIDALRKEMLRKHYLILSLKKM